MSPRAPGLSSRFSSGKLEAMLPSLPRLLRIRSEIIAYKYFLDKNSLYTS
ncbi:MAG: hypothetical protein QXR02_05045 [Acidilobaceae archaeon]